jgi:hypothetical protein
MKRWTHLFFTVSLTLMLSGFFRAPEFSESLRQKLSLYYERHMPAKIHLTFNQPEFAPGDTAYFKIYYLTPAKLAPLPGRQIVHILFRDASGALMSHTRILLHDGTGFNQIRVPRNARSGKGLVLVYGERMRNSNPDLFFQATFLISTAETEPVVSKLSFYPEGGKLIQDVNNKVVVSGPPNTVGRILSADRKELSSFELKSDGLGIFFITPAGNEKYTAELNAQSSLYATLPEAQPDGVGILARIPANRAPVTVTLQIPSGSPFRSEKLFLALTAQDHVYATANVAFGDKNFVSFSFPQQNLPNGIARLTLFRADGSVVTERLFLSKISATAIADITIPKKDFEVRSQVNFSTSVKDIEGRPLPSDVTISVYNATLFKTPESPAHNVTRSLWFSDVSGPFPQYREFNFETFAGLSSMDNFLITQTWVGFDWADVWNEKLPENRFDKYLYMTGQVSLTDGRMLPDSTLITFFLQKSVMTYELYVDGSGKFDFPLLMDFFGDEEVFYVVENRGKILRNVKIVTDADVPYERQRTDNPIFPVDAYSTYSKNKDLIDRSFAGHSRNRSHHKPGSLNALIEEEVFGADVIVNLDEYLLFPTMSETLREIVPMLQHRKVRNRDVVRLFFDDRNTFAAEQPLFIIDGVITDNTTYFLSLKPAEVVSIKVINTFNKLTAFGSVGKNGIVLVETKIPDNNLKVPRSDYTFRMQGLNKPSSWHTSQPIVKEENIPDLRSTLYWSPDLKIDSSGTAAISLRTSDDTGKFVIRVEGLTADGLPIFAEESFSVFFRPH